MNNGTYRGVAGALLVLLVSGACSRFVEVPLPSTGAPVLGGPTQGDTGATGPSDVPVTVANAAAQQAPICEATLSCAALNAEQIPLDCVKKVPYTNVLVPQGTIFQVLDNSGDFACIDSGVVVNDKQVLTCHGKELYSFQLKLTNAACGSRLQVPTGQCADGYGYDAANQCCALLGTNGSTTVTVNLGACPLPGP